MYLKQASSTRQVLEAKRLRSGDSHSKLSKRETPIMLLSYPCLCMRISNLDRAHQLIYILSHSSPSLRQYKWHPGILPVKMLQRYSVRLRIYSWFMKYCHPTIGVCGRHRQVMLVGANKHFWCRCRGRHKVEYIDKVVNKIEIGIRLLNSLTWLCFLSLLI